MLILTEKPNVSKDFAKALNCPFQKTGYYSDGKIEITNCIGHLFQLPEPEYYDEKYKSWNVIPCIPEFKYIINPTVKKQALLVINLLKKHKNDIILIATDADREGEVIARECLINADINNYDKIKRFWVSQALTSEVIRRGIEIAKPLSFYNKLAKSGFARQHSDWLTGYNFTRYVSIAAKKTLPVGRVKTAILSAIDTRCNQIEKFIPEKYYEYIGQFGNLNCTTNCIGIYINNNETKIKNNIEEKLKNDIGQPIKLINTKIEQKNIPAPQLYNLNSVQKDAFKKYNLSAKETLQIIQKLYEEYKCVSYPRTPSKVMGSGNIQLIQNIYNNLAKNYSDFEEALKYSDLTIKNIRCFNDELLEAHHALIPLKLIPTEASEIEKNIYNLILNRFKIAFAPAYIYEKRTVLLAINNNTYRISGIATVDLGWRKLDSSATLRSDENTDAEYEEQKLVNIDWEKVTLQSFVTKEKWTKPLKYYDEASILSFMENPKEENESKLIGLGTQATRHTFIPDLEKNGYIKIEKKAQKITALGRELIKAIRSSSINSFANISQTTDWEKKLEDTPEIFEEEIKKYIKNTVSKPFLLNLSANTIDETKILCPVCKKELRFGKTKKGYSNWYCTGYTNGCHFQIWETFNGSKITERNVALLCEGKITPPIKFYSSKTKKDYKAKLFLDANYQITMEFVN